MKKIYTTWLLACALIVCASPAFASSFTVLYDQVVDSSMPVPSQTGPWLSATFEDYTYNGQTGVLLTLQALALLPDEFVSTWYFNYSGDATELVLTSLSTGTGTVAYSSYSTWDPDSNGTHTPGGDFYIKISYPTRNNAGTRFVDGLVSLIFITSTDGALSAEDFLVAVDGEHYSLAHIQGMPGGLSTKVFGDLPPVSTPEPSTLILAGLGLIGAASLLRRRKN